MKGTIPHQQLLKLELMNGKEGELVQRLREHVIQNKAQRQQSPQS
jgi:hypothetical protein